MITNYEYPQSTIAQVLENTNNATLDRLHAVVVGPAYVHADVTAANLAWSSYDPSATLAYLRKVGTSSVALGTETLDEGSVQLRARNLRLTLFTKGVAGTVNNAHFKQYRAYGRSAPVGQRREQHGRRGGRDRL
jgi:hypothetical protein